MHFILLVVGILTLLFSWDYIKNKSLDLNPFEVFTLSAVGFVVSLGVTATLSGGYGLTMTILNVLNK